jgi:hypothetical protein
MSMLLKSGRYAECMVRVLLIMLAVGVGFDHYKFGGKYSDAAGRAATTIVHHFRG